MQHAHQGNHEFLEIKEELKACPFCGSADCLVMRRTRLTRDTGEDGSFTMWRYLYTVVCGGCNAEGPFRMSREGAVEAWEARR